MSETQTVTASKDGFPHEIKEGMTSIIMPAYIHNYSLFHYTGNAIGSVREHTDPEKTPYEIVLVDDASPIQLRNPSEYKVDKYVRNDENLGVTKSWNKGIRVSQGQYTCLLNNDVMVFDGWLTELIKSLEKLDLVMATPMYGEPFARAYEANQRVEKLEDASDDEIFSDFKDFSCVLTKRELFNRLGLFDEDYKTYASDSDFLKRMDNNDLRYASNKKVPIFHIIGATATSLEDNPKTMDKDKEVFDQKWGDQSSQLSQVPISTKKSEQASKLQEQSKVSEDKPSETSSTYSSTTDHLKNLKSRDG